MYIVLFLDPEYIFSFHFETPLRLAILKVLERFVLLILFLATLFLPPLLL